MRRGRARDRGGRHASERDVGVRGGVRGAGAGERAGGDGRERGRAGGARGGVRVRGRGGGGRRWTRDTGEDGADDRGGDGMRTSGEREVAEEHATRGEIVGVVRGGGGDDEGRVGRRDERETREARVSGDVESVDRWKAKGAEGGGARAGRRRAKGAWGRGARGGVRGDDGGVREKDWRGARTRGGGDAKGARCGGCERCSRARDGGGDGGAVHARRDEGFVARTRRTRVRGVRGCVRGIIGFG